MTITQYTGDINNLRHVNSNNTKIYYIVKETVQNAPAEMSRSAILKVSCFGQYATIELVDEYMKNYYWSGWETQNITSSSWNNDLAKLKYKTVYVELPVGHDWIYAPSSEINIGASKQYTQVVVTILDTIDTTLSISQAQFDKDYGTLFIRFNHANPYSVPLGIALSAIYVVE